MSLNACLRAERPPPILEPKLAPIAIDWDLEFTREPTQRGHAYWKSLCNGRAMPRRGDLRPSAMRSFLPHVNLVDVVRGAPGRPADYLVTLQGQHAHEIYGAVAQRKLSDVLPPHLETRWRNGFGLVCATARPVRFSSNMEAGGKAWLAGEALMAPLGDDESVHALFVVFVTWQLREGAGATAPP